MSHPIHPPTTAAYTAMAPLVLISSALGWIVAKFPITFTTDCL
jgi:hypothetical protein